MRSLLIVIGTSIALLAAPSSASAILYGVESNGELVNSNRTAAQRADVLDRMRDQGARVVRANFGWNEIAAACAGVDVATLRNPDNGCYSWGVADNLVSGTAERNMQLLASVSRAPQWLQANPDPYYLGTTHAEWAHTVEHYEAFMAAIAARYTAGSEHGTIRLWTVWNEPNSSTFFKPMHTAFMRALAPRRYAQMYGRAAVAIKDANPSAAIAPGPTGPNSTIKPITYIKSFQAALPSFLPGTGAAERRYISAWAHNPYPGVNNAPSRGRFKSPSVGMGNLTDLFRQLDSVAITRRLPVWATEFGYQTNPPDTTFGVSPALQGRFMGESFDLLDTHRRVTVAIWYGFTDPEELSDWQSGTYFANGQPKVSLLWYRRAISVPIGMTRRGAYVRVWARSMLNPSKTRIAVSVNGKTWRLLPAVGRKSDGTTLLRTRVTRTTWFSTWDGTRGPARVVLVR